MYLSAFIIRFLISLEILDIKCVIVTGLEVEGVSHVRSVVRILPYTILIVLRHDSSSVLNDELLHQIVDLRRLL